MSCAAMREAVSRASVRALLVGGVMSPSAVRRSSGVVSSLLRYRDVWRAGWWRRGCRVLDAWSAPSSRCLCDAAVASVDEPDLEAVCDALQLAADDQETRNLLHLIMLERTDLIFSGQYAPRRMRTRDWSELLRLQTPSARRRYFSYLAKSEFTRENEVRKKRQETNVRLSNYHQQRVQQLQQSGMDYGLSGNTILMRISDGTIKTWQDARLYQAMMFGLPVVYDMSYELNMSRREAKNTANQIMMAFGANRAHHNPFNVHLTGIRPDSELKEYLGMFFPNIDEPRFPMNLHAESYLEHFPRERLVYLTPHCSEPLKRFDPDDVYIIGGLVDLGRSIPLSLARAKRDKLRMAKLPLKTYLNIGGSFNPSLTLVAMMSILLELSDGKDWPQALKHVPHRSLMTPDQVAERQRNDRSTQMASRLRAERRWRQSVFSEEGGYSDRQRSDTGGRSDRQRSDSGEYSDRQRSDTGGYSDRQRSDTGGYSDRQRSDSGEYSDRQRSDTGGRYDRQLSDTGGRSDRQRSDTGGYSDRQRSDSGEYSDRQRSDTGGRSDRQRSDTGGRSDRQRSDTGGYSDRQRLDTGGRSDRQRSDTGGYSDRQRLDTGGRSDRQRSDTDGRFDRQRSDTGGYSDRQRSDTGGYSDRQRSNTDGYSDRQRSNTDGYSERQR